MERAESSAEEIAVAYHERTKHHFHRFAAALGDLDWATQPDPFRRFLGAPLVKLPLPAEGSSLPYADLYVPGAIAPAPLSVDSISRFFRYALSLTASKQFRGSSWSLRANPSSGNLHPTEGYAVLPAIARLSDRPGVHHYAPKEHGLERRADLDPALLGALMAGLPEGSFLVGLSSIHWREAWKYGERAFRYCQHDAGHALGALRFAAAVLGWRTRFLDRIAHRAIARLFGLDRDDDYRGAEREEAELAAVVTPADAAGDLALSDELMSALAASRWCGSANALSRAHVPWPVIDLVARATEREGRAIDERFDAFPEERELFSPPVRSGAFTAERVILGRRSAVAMDGRTSIARETFYRMLGRLIPMRGGRGLPWDSIPWRPRIHLGLFVHRVRDLPPGLYVLARDPEKVDALRHAMKPDFAWTKPEGCPPALPLYGLERGDRTALASEVSCHQEIAGDGAFSVTMIAEYLASLAAFGAPFYRLLFWECGLVGQVLYLEAEEAGIRSTGIGCYYDDPAHEVYGLRTRDWQSLYHFTVGGPVEDTRLRTLDPYETRNFIDGA
jgi:SagB-type dehydrogenase family enzyme